MTCSGRACGQLVAKERADTAWWSTLEEFELTARQSPRKLFYLAVGTLLAQLLPTPLMCSGCSQHQFRLVNILGINEVRTIWPLLQTWAAKWTYLTLPYLWLQVIWAIYLFTFYLTFMSNLFIYVLLLRQSPLIDIANWKWGFWFL